MRMLDEADTVMILTIKVWFWFVELHYREHLRQQGTAESMDKNRMKHYNRGCEPVEKPQSFFLAF